MINPRHAALLIIDVQQGLFSRPTPIHQAEQLLQNINTLVDRAHRAGTPIFFIQHSNQNILPYGSTDWKLHPQLHRLDTDDIIPKQQGNAFDQTSLQKELGQGTSTRWSSQGW